MDESEFRRTEARPAGLIDSIKSMIGTFLQLVHTRVELFTTELEEEMHRIAMLLVWLIVAVFFGGLFVLMLSLTVVIAFWDTHRLLAAILMTTLFAAILAVAAVVVRNKLRAHGHLLANTIEELKRDREALERHGARHP